MYDQYNVLPTLPGRDPHFASPLPPPKHDNDRLPREQNPYKPNPQSFMDFLSYIQTLDERSQRRLKIWKFDEHQNLLGFGDGTKEMMRFIARHLRELHTSFNYCSDLLNRVHIQLPYFRAIFPCDPICTVQLKDPVRSLTAGIIDDTHQFREMVSLLLKSTPDLINLSQPLPIDFQLFFSKVFSCNLRLGDIERVKEFSYYVLFHPITHSYPDRMAFIHTIVFYRDRDPVRFDEPSSLENPAYELQHWKKNYPPTHFLYGMMLRAISANKGSKNSGVQPSSIPKFIRNAFHHLREENKMVDPNAFNTMLDENFPGICAKFLDWILREFNKDPGEFKLKLWAHLKE